MINYGVLCFILLYSFSASANSKIDKIKNSKKKGAALFKWVDKNDQGWKSLKTLIKMTLKDSTGKKQTRKFSLICVESSGDSSEKCIINFRTPSDIKGTELLTFTNRNSDDDQWLYLPAIRRVKRISSTNKGSPFMSSEFSYEDLTDLVVDKYKYKYIKDEKCNGKSCYVVIQTPIDKDSPYEKYIVWIEKLRPVFSKIEFYDRKGELLKTLKYKKHKKYKKKYYRAEKLIMENHQNGKSTILQFKPYKFRAGLQESDFNKNRLGKMN